MSPSTTIRSSSDRPLRDLVCFVLAAVIAVLASSATLHAAQDDRLTQGPLRFGAFEARFVASTTNAPAAFRIAGDGWPALAGSWRFADGELVLTPAEGSQEPPGCAAPGVYRLQPVGENGVRLEHRSDECRIRRMVLDRSIWHPADEPIEQPAREIVRTQHQPASALPAAVATDVKWPGFRGPAARGVLDGVDLPDRWNVETGNGIRWRVEIPGLAHSSPAIWGDVVFVTTAISSGGPSDFRPGLYGDGDAADDRHQHSFEIWALSRKDGSVVWKRTAARAVPTDRRHIKSTYANATPATDGRIVVASFGSEGVHAYTMSGTPLWSLDLGRMDLGAYDVPSYEWGPASSPTIWNGIVFLQVDTQLDSFVLAVRADDGTTLWKADRDELPTWGTPTVVGVEPLEGGPSEAALEPAWQLVTNGSNFIRSYDARSGQEIWRLGRSSKITAPTPFFADGLIFVASGRAPERPLFAVRPDARGDITLADGQDASQAVAWSRERRGSYMPTPLVYRGVLYVLANNGVLDAYSAATGEEHYRQRIDHGGSGFSGSPVAADGRLYLPGEDGDVFVVRTGTEFELIQRNEMGGLLMSTPALAPGVMLVRTKDHLTAIGR